jgi:hypothetical protein
MTNVPFTCGIGFAPEVPLIAAATVDLSTVDGNLISITGTTPITSFGTTPDLFRIVYFRSAVSLVNSSTFRLYNGQSRTTTAFQYSIFISDITGNWLEVATAPVPPTPLSQFGLLSMQVFASTQTITVPANVSKAVVRMSGATGGSGGCTGTGGNSGGTGAPGYLEKFLSGLTPGTTMSFTCGAAGGAGASGGGTGGNGTASTLVAGALTMTANGSAGTNGVNGNESGGSPGGTATGGDFNVQGQSGFTAYTSVSGNVNQQGAAGVGPLVSGAPGRSAVSSAGFSGNPGLLVIEWYT